MVFAGRFDPPAIIVKILDGYLIETAEGLLPITPDLEPEGTPLTYKPGEKVIMAFEGNENVCVNVVIREGEAGYNLSFWPKFGKYDLEW